MPAKTDVIEGGVKLKGLVDAACIKDVPDLLQKLSELITVEIPANVSNVTIGPAQPGSDERDHLWVRLDASSDFVGLYVFAVGQWRQIYPVPNELFWVFGDSRKPPAGFTLAIDSVELTTSQKNFLKENWHWNNDVPNTYYDVFQVIYTGF